MPLLKLKLTSKINDAAKQELGIALTELTERHLHKDPALTAIIIEQFPSDDWYIGGQALSIHNLNSFALEIAVTEATNTKAEFAAFIDNVFSKMTEKLGDMHEASYVIVNEVPAYAWGFSGRTQEYRFVTTHANKVAA